MGHRERATQSRETKITLAHVEQLLPEALAQVSQQILTNCCVHVERVENEAWKRDAIIDSQIEQVIFNNSGSSDTLDQYIAQH